MKIRRSEMTVRETDEEIVYFWKRTEKKTSDYLTLMRNLILIRLS
jgi:hypothetical protein